MAPGSEEVDGAIDMKADLLAGALDTREIAYCSNMMREPGFGTRFDCVPIYTDDA